MIHSKRQAAGLVIGTLLFAMSAPVYSIGILDAYSLALEKDPTFRAAIKRKRSGRLERKYRQGGAAAEGIAELPEFAAQLANAEVPAKRFLWQHYGSDASSAVPQLLQLGDVDAAAVRL